MLRNKKSLGFKCVANSPCTKWCCSSIIRGVMEVGEGSDLSGWRRTSSCIPCPHMSCDDIPESEIKLFARNMTNKTQKHELSKLTVKLKSWSYWFCINVQNFKMKNLKLKKQVWVSAYWRDPPIQQQATASPWPSPLSRLLILSLHSAWAASNASGWHRLQSSGSQSRLHLGFSQKFILILGLRANPRSMKSASPSSGRGDRRCPGDCYMRPRLTTAAPEGQSYSNLVPVWGHKPVLLQWLRR